MAAAYGAGMVLLFWAAAWITGTAVGAWFRHKDKQSKEKTA